MSNPTDEKLVGVVWDYIRPSASFQNSGRYAPPNTPRVHSFPTTPRTEPAIVNPPVGGLGTDSRKTQHNPYRVGFTSFERRFSYLRQQNGRMSRSPGPGAYDFRHVNGGAMVKRPMVASPCFCRPEGRLNIGQTGTWHQDTPLTSAEIRGTIHGDLKIQPLRYSHSFRSKADRLVFNKPPKTTHAGIGPGCYDLTKDGKSVSVKVEKRVDRGGTNRCDAMTNPFLSPWRALMQPRVLDGSTQSVPGESSGYFEGGNVRGNSATTHPSLLRYRELHAISQKPVRANCMINDWHERSREAAGMPDARGIFHFLQRRKECGREQPGRCGRDDRDPREQKVFGCHREQRQQPQQPQGQKRPGSSRSRRPSTLSYFSRRHFPLVAARAPDSSKTSNKSQNKDDGGKEGKISIYAATMIVRHSLKTQRGEWNGRRPTDTSPTNVDVPHDGGEKRCTMIVDQGETSSTGSAPINSRLLIPHPPSANAVARPRTATLSRRENPRRNWVDAQIRKIMETRYNLR